MHSDVRVLAEEFQKLTHLERRVVDRLLRRKTVARDPNAAFDERLTMAQRTADRVAAFGGSWTFIILFLGAMMIWMTYNAQGAGRFDPYPFILLNLVLSCLAALQAPIIMMSQNRQAAKDRLDAQHDYEVNLKAEMEIAALHLKVDELREREWSALLDIQREQLGLLQQIQARLTTG
jgi:uncharacterized membrane protein